MQPCSICPRNFQPIRGDGPQPSPLLFIGERPGENENKLDCVFVGRSGEELDHTYLPLAGLHRSDIRITNAVKCWAENNKTPTDREIQICGSHWLPREIDRCQPEAIVLLGGCASKLTNGLINLETHHGRPIKVSNFNGSGWSGWVWPTYHPAMGMHSTDKMTPLLEDFETLGKWLGKRWSPPVPSTDPKSYKLIKNASDFHRYLLSATHSYQFPNPAVDTERHGPTPFSIQFSLYPHSGRMILSDSPALQAFRKWSAEQEFTLHNAPQDLDLLESGFGVVPRSHRDTMQEAFHLGNQPQKLKALAYRLLGVTMRTWEDVVRPASVNKALEWLGEALQIAESDLRLVEFVRMKTKTKEVYKNSPTATALTRIIRCSNNPEYDIWDKIADHWAKENGLFDYDRSHIENRLGTIPILGIGNCKLPDAVDYGCSDADHTGQVEIELEKLRGDKRYAIDDGDRDNQD